jgi:hypothetical protein
MNASAFGASVATDRARPLRACSVVGSASTMNTALLNAGKELEMTEKDKEIQELRRENSKLRAELARTKEIQMRLFKLVPAEALILLAKEYPEKLL